MIKSTGSLGFSSRSIHFGYDPFDNKGALNSPIFLTSTFAFESSDEAAATFSGRTNKYAYGRVHNPTQSILESRLASLEGAQASLVTASGMAALTSLILSQLRSGDEVVAHLRMYGNTFSFLTDALPRFGIQVKFVDLMSCEQLEVEISARTKMVLFECPANPLLEVLDIRRISQIASARGVITVVDSTLASPYLLRPLLLGADVVIHSATKYLGGHGDVLGGVISGGEQLIQEVRRRGLRYITGATLSPFAVFLILRGLKTLSIRMERHSKNAGYLTEMLRDHPKVRRVYYPQKLDVGEAGNHCLGSIGGPGLFSFDLEGGKEAALKLMDSLQLARIGVSFGDPETLIQHPASMTHAAYNRNDTVASGISDSTLRVSVGLEDIEDILLDFESALGCL